MPTIKNLHGEAWSRSDRTRSAFFIHLPAPDRRAVLQKVATFA
jgi:hypothetical protein